MLAQLRRLEHGKNPRPTLEDIRETGVIEQEASVVAGLWINDKSDEGDAELIVLKNRFGALTTIPLRWRSSRQEFVTRSSVRPGT